MKWGKFRCKVGTINVVEIWKTRKAKYKRLCLSIAKISRKSLDNWGKLWADKKGAYFWYRLSVGLNCRVKAMDEPWRDVS